MYVIAVYVLRMYTIFYIKTNCLISNRNVLSQM